eukprot:CAMPEP_0176332406 /NCGR_PEP_ID=MMETSP0121_2-20121125/77056_1 /TAXON_ID=160619 /ORGANISM="Kryptoperidinium foliaceum, Strain CCMP 1326" /LENGTH=140 /DNA_ID=CAMNT_0017675295 /DNA_START=437 /DNA_END=855 /DNA_ORIENTATION=+
MLDDGLDDRPHVFDGRDRVPWSMDRDQNRHPREPAETARAVTHGHCLLRSHVADDLPHQIAQAAQVRRADLTIDETPTIPVLSLRVAEAPNEASSVRGVAGIPHGEAQQLAPEMLLEAPQLRIGDDRHIQPVEPNHEDWR